MMLRAIKKAPPPRNPWANRALLAGCVLAVQLILTLLWWQYGRSSRSKSIETELGTGSMASQHDQLMGLIKQWNSKAATSDPSLVIPLATDTHVTSSSNAAIQQQLHMEAQQTQQELQFQLLKQHQQDQHLQALQAAQGVSTTQPGSTCDPPDPAYQMKPAAEVAKENEELVEKLKKHAINNEIMLTLANGIMICKNTTICWWNGGNILESFLTVLSHNNITNYLIGVMDDETEEYLKKRPQPSNWFRVNIKIPEAQKKSHPANQVSTIKYTLLKTFLQLGYHTLVTDMDLVYMSNPFKHLHRDADIEIQTDGFDDMAYGVFDGIRDPTMGWGGGGLFVKTFTTNVGCMYVKANARSFKLMEQVSRHLAEKPGWDQQIFNEYLMRPSHGDFQSAYAHLRILDIDYWLNSKIFFRSRRGQYLPGASSKAPTPILVHMNYHPDKHKRMLCLMDRYFYGKLDACDAFPGGSDPGT